MIEESLNVLDEEGLSHFWQAVPQGGQEQIRHLVTIGDSFGDAADQGPNLWPVLLGKQLRLSLHNYCQGGAGYVKLGNAYPHRTFGDELQAAIEDASFANADVSLVVVYGGYNDVATSQDLTTFAANALSLFSTAQANFPNARVVVFGINTACRATDLNAGSYIFNNYFKRLVEAANTTGVAFVNSCLWNAGDLTLYKSDFLHPSELGSKLIARNMLACVNGSLWTTVLGARPELETQLWVKPNSITNLDVIFTPTSDPNSFNVTFKWEAGSASGASWNYTICTMSYLRAIPAHIVVPVFKQIVASGDARSYEYAGCAFRNDANAISAKFINAVAAGDVYVTGQFVFNTYTDTVTYTSQ